jgi:hypothetical protein
MLEFPCAFISAAVNVPRPRGFLFTSTKAL